MARKEEAWVHSFTGTARRAQHTPPGHKGGSPQFGHGASIHRNRPEGTTHRSFTDPLPPQSSTVKILVVYEDGDSDTASIHVIHPTPTHPYTQHSSRKKSAKRGFPWYVPSWYPRRSCSLSCMHLTMYLRFFAVFPVLLGAAAGLSCRKPHQLPVPRYTMPYTRRGATTAVLTPPERASSIQCC